MNLIHLIRAEVSKLRSLPLAWFSCLATILISMASTSMMAGNLAEQGLPGGVNDVVLGSVPFIQVGMILCGIVPASHEHAGGQYRTSLVAVPQRTAFVVSKSVAALFLLAATAVIALAVSLGTALITLQLMDASPTGQLFLGEEQLFTLGGAALYLGLIGMLSHALALLVRTFVPALITALTLVLILPPLLSVTEYARWLPSRAGELLYQTGADPILTAETGTLVLLGWILGIGSVGLIVTCVTDARS